MKFANVIIDNKSNSTDNSFTYICEDDSLEVGSKVFVPFARSRNLREGYIVSFTEESEISKELLPKLKKIDSADEEISLTEEMIRTALWMRERYLCRYIDAIKCFTPAGQKPVRKKSPDSPEEEYFTTGKIERLTDEQRNALDRIESAIEKGIHDSFLIHGVTGSGKTEIYIRAAEKTVLMGRTVILLVPEISLTGQITERFLNYFGEDSVEVLHSRLTGGQRYERWQRIRRGHAKIVIGARSAVFAPVENPGLIIVDEEHETTYKSDFTPKYDTVEVAMKRLKDRDSNGVLVLGSATPSIVTYSRADEGIFKLLKLTKRYNDVKLPEAEIIDMRQELSEGNASVISGRLYREMKKCLGEGRQVMLFLNRRGYSTFVSCRECGYVAKCPECGLSLVHHKNKNALTCHYCGYSRPVPAECPECGSRYIRYFGSGTEKLEEEIRNMFPEYNADRIDVDTVSGKGALNRRLGKFGKGETDILIGTQIIAKGLDFRNVGLVGIVSADVSLNIPDFRSPERTFQLITQAAGRAGRGDAEGKVIIQTYSPESYAVKMAARQNYESFYAYEMDFRKIMKYPPLSDMFQILFTAPDPETAQSGAMLWYDRLKAMMRPEDRENLFTPQEAYMNKVRDSYRYSMIIKCPKGKRREYSAMIRSIKDEEKKKKTGYTAVVDINPYSFA